MGNELSDNAVRLSMVSRRQTLRGGVAAMLIGTGLLGAASTSAADVDPKAAGTQTGWRWCRKCQGFFFGSGASRCPAGNAHDSAGSFAYYLWYSDGFLDSRMQSGWRWCRKCQSLAYAGGGAGFCPGLGRHDHTGSFNYHLWHDVGPLLPSEQDQWRWCHKCQNLFYGPNQRSSWCPYASLNRHESTGSFNYMIQFTSSAPASNEAPRLPAATKEK